MTDARFPERWLNDRRVLRLPDDAFRLFVLSLAWSVANRTDGQLYDDDLTLIPASTAGSGPLAKAGLWERVADYWQITVFEETQTSAAQLEAIAVARRANDRERQARHRARPSPGDKSRDRSRDNPRDNTRTGQARTGIDEQPLTTGVPAENAGTVRICLGCPEKPRNGCRTCWDHAYLETSP